MPRKAAATALADVTLAEPASYEAALQELEGLIQGMETGQLPLDDMLANYQRGGHLLGYCRSQLAAVEHQVKVLEDGQLKPWGENE